MLKGEDPIILLKLASKRDRWTLRSLESEIAISRSVIHRSLGRLAQAGLLDATHRVNVAQAEEFLIHGMRYVFPPIQQGATRGNPTAWAAAPLEDELAPSNDLPPVWPDPEGETRGIALQPLHPAASEIYHRDKKLTEQLALLDALRLGSPRIRGLAAKLLREHIAAEPKAT